ncbi:MAG TPA: ABC transporter substrate-binding protein [Acidimicrobiales bacterium]
MRPTVSLKSVAAAGAMALTLALSASAVPTAAGAATTPHAKLTIRLGFQPNVTHATDLVALHNGFFAAAVGSNVSVSATGFNAGPDEVTALLGGQLDAAFLGPVPAISAFQVSGGQYQIVAGAGSGGAAFVVKPYIKVAKNLKGKTVSSPQLGNTQDIALRVWLKSKGLSTSIGGGGDVSINPQPNSQIVTAFQANAIAGAWVPQPYVAELVADGGHVLVNEASLWPNGRFATNVLVVNKGFLKAHPQAIKHLILGELNAIAQINANKVGAEAEVNAAIKFYAGKALKPAIMHAALQAVALTYDPIAPSIDKDAVNAYKLTFLKTANVKGMYNVTLLNQLLVAEHKAPVIPQ